MIPRGRVAWSPALVTWSTALWPLESGIRPIAVLGAYLATLGDDKMSKAKAVRSAQEVIDQAIADNRFGEYLLYSFAIVFVTAGVVLIGVGIFRNNPYAMIGGPVESVLFVPAMRWGWKIRRANIAIRLLEAPLSRAKTADEAATAIRQFFEEALGSGRQP